MKKFLVFATILFSFTICSSGQVVPKYVFSADIQKDIDKTLAEKKNLWNIQNHAVQFSFIGNYEASLKAHKLFSEQNRQQINPVEPSKADLESFRKYKPVNAVKAITKEAEKYTIVITNEAHYQPQNRVFTTSLLKSLYRKGFRYLATEDLAIDDKILKRKSDAELNDRKYAVKKTGYYILEPQYGNMVRTALEIGYTLVPYDYYGSDKKDPMERFVARESGQAKNLADILVKDSKAKILVHSGYGHLNERIGKSGVGLMGAVLKQNHNIDPLTIDQISYLPEQNDDYSKSISIKKPSVFKNKKGELFSPVDATIKTDIKVLFPKTQYKNGRPNWLFYQKGRKYYYPKLKGVDLKYPLMVMAYVAGEDIENAIPFDVMEINNPGERKALVLEKGKYTQIIKSIEGNTSKSVIRIK